MLIGIRREDKNEWERRVPLTPDDVRRLAGQGVEVQLQPSPLRIFSDAAYRQAGARIDEDLTPCPVVLAVKEIPAQLLEPHKTYMFFSHTMKGQEQNMPMLQRLMALGCNLIDYELVTDDQGRRLVFFGRHAGTAGMIDSFWALGKRFESEGVPTPFSQIDRAYNYEDMAAIGRAFAATAERIGAGDIPSTLAPLIFGFAGYGNVSQGAQEIFDLLPHEEISPAEVATVATAATTTSSKLYKVVFKEEDLVEALDPNAPFELQDYYQQPQRYRSRFEQYLPYLTVLVNCIYWDPRYPRLVTREFLARSFAGGQRPALRVLGDISCDIEGSIECTIKSTEPGNPVYVYDPENETVTDGWEGNGPVVLAVDNLPCELARDASEFFSRVLTPFVPQLAQTDFTASLTHLTLPAELKRALIVHQGELVPNYEHLQEYL